MRLTKFTDYAMRILLFLAVKPEEMVTAAQIAKKYKISQNHLVKIVQDLVHLGYIESTKGRGGGMRLAIPAAQINLGQIVKKLEPDMRLIDCVGCEISQACSLPGPLHKALSAFLQVLSQYSLQDIVESSPNLEPILFGASS